ncbi:MAG: autotransporter-associated beta strand repeat-containing protein [Verrucomicrobia bacterium]|nr:autotransporter-associated beta strand repeat-containing protein [Verrucomicrobiota bacterium]
MNARQTTTTTFIAFAVLTIALATTSFAQKNYSRGTINVTPANVGRTTLNGVINSVSGTAIVTITAPGVTVTTLSGGTLRAGAATGTASSVPVTIGTWTGNATSFGGNVTVLKTGNLTVSALGGNPVRNLTVSGGSLSLPNSALIVRETFTMRGGSLSGGSISARRFTLSAGTIGASLIGSSALTKTGAGTLTLNGAANNYSGLTKVTAGTLVIGPASGLPANGALTVNGGTLDLGGTSQTLTTVTVSRGTISNGDISASSAYSVSGGTINANLGGTAALTKTGTGKAILTGINTYTGNGGTTTVSAGTLQVSSVSSLPSNVLNNGVLTFNQSTSETYSAVINGRGRLTKIGDGTLTLTGTNVYTGGTTISGGTLAVSDGTLPLPSGRTTIVNNATLSFDNSTLSQVTFAAPVSGRGAFVKTGLGTVVLSGANTYSGGTTVSAGTLAGSPRSLRGAILNNGTVVFDTSSLSGTQSGAITGTGRLIKQGIGTLTLTGRNSYAGGTTVDGGTVSGSATSLQGDIAAIGGVVRFNQTAAGTYAGNISGVGSLIKVGAGALTLTGTNTYSGGTTVTSGTLQGNSSNLQGAIVNNATVVFDQAVAGEYAGVMSGRGRLTKSGSGTLTLSAGNQYTGGTTVSGGFLAGTVNSVQGNIVNNAHVQLTEDDTGTYLGAMSGTGVLQKLGGGTLTLTGRNNYRGGTIVVAGTLAGSTLSVQGSITNDGVVQFEQTTTGTYAGSMSGSGQLVKVGSGQLTLSGANTYSGGTLVNSGTLVGNAASLQGGIVNGTVVTFNQSGTGTYAGVMSGRGSLTKSGSGTLVLSGINTYTGDTTVSAGTLQGDTSSLQGNIANNAQVIFNQATTGTYAGLMFGSGRLQKTGAGTLSLLSANTYRGTTTLSSGGLYIEGNQAGATGALTVASGATLGGKGTIGGATTITGNHRIGQSAVTSPADTAGIQTFSRGLTYQAGASAFWRLMDNTTSLGTAGNYAYDQAVVGGTLTATSAQALTFDMSFASLGSVVDWSNEFWAEEREGTAGWLVYNAARLSLRGTLAPSGTLLDSKGAELSTERPDYTFAFFQDTANGDVYLNYIYSP